MDEKRTLRYAKQLRQEMTDAEQRVWYHLRAHRFFGLKFRRQKPLGKFIVDFVCMERKLVVELDGGQHAEREGYDNARSQWLLAQGYKVLRFWNDDVLRDTEVVLEAIRQAVVSESDARSPGPSPASGRGE